MIGGVAHRVVKSTEPTKPEVNPMRCFLKNSGHMSPVTFAHAEALIREGGEQGMRAIPRDGFHKSYRARAPYSASALSAATPFGVILPPRCAERSFSWLPLRAPVQKFLRQSL